MLNKHYLENERRDGRERCLRSQCHRPVTQRCADVVSVRYLELPNQCFLASDIKKWCKMMVRTQTLESDRCK